MNQIDLIKGSSKFAQNFKNILFKKHMSHIVKKKILIIIIIVFLLIQIIGW